MLHLIASLGLFFGTAHAAISAPWEIKSVEIHQVVDQVPSTALIPTDNGCTQSMHTNALDMTDLSQIFTLGQKAWEIVQANKPVVNVGQSPMLSALPFNNGCWMDLVGWQQPKVQTYEVAYKNAFGMEVVQFRFRVQFNYGGSVNGAGKFLANVTVVPDTVNVTWGYTFSANVTGEQALNLGTAAQPLAGLGLTVNWSVKTVMKESDNSFHFFVEGDGTVKADGQAVPVGFKLPLALNKVQSQCQAAGAYCFVEQSTCCGWCAPEGQDPNGTQWGACVDPQ